MEFFERLFSSGSGLSSMRWVFIWSYLFCIVVPLSIWSIAYLQDTTADIPDNVMYIVIGVISVITTGKVTQGFGEAKAKQNATVPPQS